LLIGRTFDSYMPETKTFNGNLRINELGEFLVKYNAGRSSESSPRWSKAAVMNGSC